MHLYFPLTKSFTPMLHICMRFFLQFWLPAIEWIRLILVCGSKNRQQSLSCWIPPKVSLWGSPILYTFVLQSSHSSPSRLVQIPDCARHLWHTYYNQTSYLRNRSLDLTLSDYRTGKPEYGQTTPAGHIFFGFWSLKWKSHRNCLEICSRVIRHSLGAPPLGKV